MDLGGLGGLGGSGDGARIAGMAIAMAIAIAGAVGCDADIDGEDDVVLRSGGGATCRTCGYKNSPLLGKFALDEFTLPSAPAPTTGLQLVEILDPSGQPATVKVDDEAFVATSGGTIYGGAQLVGWSLVFAAASGERFEVEIAVAGAVADWATGAMVPSYTLLYRDPATPDGDDNLCPGVDPDHPSIVLISGERYDFESKTVHPGATDMVTLACHGHAIAKLRMLGYGPNDAAGATPSQRQAALKMLTADYCGMGHSFTEIGRPLDWHDALDTFISGITDPTRVEAKWTAAGASCLDKPRLVNRSEVEHECANLPTCKGNLALGSNDWISLNP